MGQSTNKASPRMTWARPRVLRCAVRRQRRHRPPGGDINHLRAQVGTLPVRLRTASAAPRTPAWTTSPPVFRDQHRLADLRHIPPSTSSAGPSTCSCTASWRRPSRSPCATGFCTSSAAWPAVSLLAPHTTRLAVGSRPGHGVRPAGHAARSSRT